AYGHILPESFFAPFNVPAQTQLWHERISNGEYTEEKRLFVAEKDDKVAGFSIGGPARFDGRMANGELWTLYVDQAQSRSGAGGLLLNAVKDFLKSQNHDGMYVMSMRGNEMARAFYERMGGTMNPNPFTTDFNGTIVDDTSLYWKF
ncbi:MAG: GNAT family N-acetyltransferase, partial [Alphaproteobacteria bacterium]|nr:GNAT family N-acetyltransferase [Alphaproteobacteria bacterium]